jgi:hypothetical protein
MKSKKLAEQGVLVMLQENDSFSNSRIVVFVHRRIRLICLLARHSIRPEMLPISLRCMDILLQS